MKKSKLEIAHIYKIVKQAVARGWCHEKNEKKVMDVDLAEAISYEVSKLLINSR